MTKSYVGTGHHLCPVCCKKHGESVLIDQRMKDTLETGMFLGWEMCPEHRKLFMDGFIACVAVNNGADNLKLEEADRTGEIAHIKASAWPKIFNCPAPPKGLCFVEPGVVVLLKEMMEGAEE